MSSAAAKWVIVGLCSCIITIGCLAVLIGYFGLQSWFIAAALGIPALLLWCLAWVVWWYWV